MRDMPKSVPIVTANIIPTKSIIYHLLNLKRITVKKIAIIIEIACKKIDTVDFAINPSKKASIAI